MDLQRGKFKALLLNCQKLYGEPRGGAMWCIGTRQSKRTGVVLMNNPHLLFLFLMAIHLIMRPVTIRAVNDPSSTLPIGHISYFN